MASKLLSFSYQSVIRVPQFNTLKMGKMTEVGNFGAEIDVINGEWTFTVTQGGVYWLFIDAEPNGAVSVGYRSCGFVASFEGSAEKSLLGATSNNNGCRGEGPVELRQGMRIKAAVGQASDMLLNMDFTVHLGGTLLT